MASARGGALTALLVVCALSGCSSARQVVVSQEGGCIAIPENSDVWPFKYRTKAMELIKNQCPQGYEIVREQEVVVGQVTTDREATDQETQDVSSRRRPNATLTSTSTSHSTDVRDRTEYRIYYRKRGVVESRPTMVQTSVPVSRPVMPVSGSLPPEPIPVGN